NAGSSPPAGGASFPTLRFRFDIFCSASGCRMIERYSRPEMAAIWSEEEKLRIWLEVELLACEAMAEHGEIPRDVPAKLGARARVNVARIHEIERQVAHDVIAFVTAVAETCGPEGRYLHLGLTSSDVLDTAFAVQLVRAADLLISDAG